MEYVGGSRTVAYVVELCVGIACLIAAAGTWRRPGLRVLAAILFVAGMAAAIHALIALL